MTDKSVLRSAAIVVFVAMLVPTAAWAQGTITGACAMAREPCSPASRWLRVRS